MSDNSIQGRCLACDGRTLFRGDGGYLTCSLIGCPDPGATGEFLERGIDYDNMASYLHASIWSMFQDEAIPTRKKVMHLVETLWQIGIGDTDEQL